MIAGLAIALAEHPNGSTVVTDMFDYIKMFCNPRFAAMAPPATCHL